MIAPNEITPAGRELAESRGHTEAELFGDIGRRIRATRSRFVPRDPRLRSQPIRRLVRPLQAQAEARLSTGARHPAKFDARAHARSLRRPRLVVIQGAILSPRFVEGALKRIASGSDVIARFRRTS
jgi:hypothetical protein